MKRARKKIWKIPMIKPTTKATTNMGAEINIVIHSACRAKSTTMAVSIGTPYLKIKLEANEPISRVQPSTNTNNMSLKGMEMIMGDSIIMPMDINTLATIKSMTTNGM